MKLKYNIELDMNISILDIWGYEQYAYVIRNALKEHSICKDIKIEGVIEL